MLLGSLVGIIIGFIVLLLGRWFRNESDQPKGREHVEGIKTGLGIMAFGVLIIIASIWILLTAIQELF